MLRGCQATACEGARETQRKVRSAQKTRDALMLNMCWGWVHICTCARISVLGCGRETPRQIYRFARIPLAKQPRNAVAIYMRPGIRHTEYRLCLLWALVLRKYIQNGSDVKSVRSKFAKRFTSFFLCMFMINEGLYFDVNDKIKMQYI